MPEYCSCGAKLPVDARFCHKCGKPLFSIEPEVVAVVEPEPIVPAVAQPVPVFRSPLAVRIAIFSGLFSVLATIASGEVLALLSPVLGFFAYGWCFLGGLGATLLYARRSGSPVTISDGARLGWLTGLIAFTAFALLLTLSVVAVGLTPFLQQATKSAGTSAASQEMVRVLSSPAGAMTALMLGLIFFFALVSALGTAGGAVGAKMSAKN